MSEESQLVVLAHSTLHGLTYRAPLDGEINAVAADGEFDLSHPVSGRLEIDLGHLKGDDPHTDGEMHRRLETRRYPRVTAAIDSVTAKGNEVFHLCGSLTLHGRTQPVEGDANVILVGDELRATGSVELDVRAFGIKPPSLVIVRVNPIVTVEIDLVATPAES